MKNAFFIALIVLFSLLVIPILAFSNNKEVEKSVAGTISDVVYNTNLQNDNTLGFTKIKVLKNGEVLELSAKEYVFGVVAAEMPALFEEEALKAQAVAAYTFACYRINTTSNTEYDITSDGETAQCYITREEAAARWGEKAEEYSQKIESCISAVQNEILVFNGQPIFAAYHAISSGRTNSCADVWGNELTYLQSVDSAGDTLSDGYLSEVKFTAEEIAEKLKNITTASGDIKDYFTNINKTDNGLVKSISYCNQTVSGWQICNYLGLRSSNFTISFSENVFTFTVKGYGHGVGMSQTGADYMAKQGSGYKEILLHYYKNVDLQKF